MTNANDPSSRPANDDISANGASPDGEDSSALARSEQETAGATSATEESGEAPKAPRAPLINWPTTAEEFAAELRRLDWVLLGVGIVLSFLAASFAIRNTDFWMHLATGRLLAGGNYHFGTDPFAYTTGDSYWVNHSWLFDIGLYGLTGLVGGPESDAAGIALVGLRAVVAVLIFLLIVALRSPGQSLGGPVACAALAVLAMSPRLLLQPMLLSVLFLTVTLYVLAKPQVSAEPDMPREGRSSLWYWLLPPLFVLWVNVDSWFFLGPLIVLLYLVGQVVQTSVAPVRYGSDAPTRGLVTQLFVVFIVGTAACLINPYHYHAFTIPAQLSAAGLRSLLAGDSLLGQWFRSPIDEYVSRERGQMTAVGLAYFILLGLGCVSFILNLTIHWRWWRLFVWFPFAALSLYQFRTVGFFAVVAAPITALNLHDFAKVRWPRTAQRQRSWVISVLTGRAVMIVIGAALALAAWPGWLQATITGSVRFPQRVAWEVWIDPSLKAAAEKVKEWRTQGLISPAEQGIHYIPEFVNYCAWYCVDDHGLPLEKGFYDYRLEQFPYDVSKLYVDLRKGLREGLDRAESTGTFTGKKGWRGLLNEYGIRHIVLNSTVPGGVEAVRHLAQDSSEWRLAYLDGRTTIFTLNEPQPPGAGASGGLPPLDLNAMAFGPHPEKAPAEFTRDPQPQSFWTRFRDGPPVRPLSADQSQRYQNYFDAVSNSWPVAGLIANEIGAWGSAAERIPSSTPLAILPTLPLRAVFGARQGPYLAMFLAGKDLGPPAAPVLALRAARRAVSESPDDPSVYATLAQAYIVLWSRQEYHWQPVLRQEAELLTHQKLRQVQLVTALEQCLKLNPAEAEVHLILWSHYKSPQVHCFDLALEHLEAAIRLLSKQSGKADEVAGRVEELQKELQNLDAGVNKLRDSYELSASELPPLGKVRLALSKGLAKPALEVLTEANLDELGGEAVSNYLDLLLSTGKADDVRREMLSNENLRRLLGSFFARYQVLLDAATGNYDEAVQLLDAMIRQASSTSMLTLLQGVREGTFLRGISPSLLRGLVSFPEIVRQLAEYQVIRGLLSLEEGDNAVAATSFAQALETAGNEKLEFNGRVFAKRYLELIRQAGGDKK
jgi:hypothetical protein